MSSTAEYTPEVRKILATTKLPVFRGDELREGSRPERNARSVQVDLEQRYIGLIASADNYLQQITQGNNFLIDASVIHYSEGSLSPEQILPEFGALRNDISRERQNLKSSWSAPYRSLPAIKIFLQQMIKDPQDRLPYEVLYAVVTGDMLIPRRSASGEIGLPITPNDLKDARDKFLDDLSTREQFDRDNPDEVRGAYAHYHTKNILIVPGDQAASQRAIEAVMRRTDYNLRPQLARNLKREYLMNFDFDFEWIEDPSGAYNFWERGTIDRLWLISNGSRVEEINAAVAEEFTKHEIEGHFGILYSLGEGIRQGRVDRVLGILPIPDPRCVTFEGIAVKLDALVGLETTSDGKLGGSLYYMNKLARAEAIFKVMTQGVTVEQATKDAMIYFPNKTPDEVFNEIKKCTGDFFWSLYGPIYGTAGLAMKRLSERWGTGALQVLGENYTSPMIPQQLFNYPIGRLLT